MNWLKDKTQIEQRPDGSFVIMVEYQDGWVPYHVTQEHRPELYAEVKAFFEAPEV